jgi:hypothetical protein
MFGERAKASVGIHDIRVSLAQRFIGKTPGLRTCLRRTVALAFVQIVLTLVMLDRVNWSYHAESTLGMLSISPS